MSEPTCHSHEKKAGKKVCPVCGGKKTVPGVCSCNMEWRGSQIGDQWEDCQCTPEVTCTECNGSGFIGED